jgi:hypothetical protein
MNTLSSTIHSRRRLLAVAGGTVVLLSGFLVGLPHKTPPPVLAASCQIAHQTCAGGLDPTKTAVLTVLHQVSGGTWVEPNTGESWDITATWNSAGVLCPNPTVQVATVTVDWNGSGWTLSNKNLTGDIVDVQVCNISGSCGSAVGPRAYKLRVDINDPIAGPQNLQSVAFVTTSVDDGFTIDLSSCTTTTTAVSPTSQTFSATDYGSFECDYACANVTGPSLTITY